MGDMRDVEVTKLPINLAQFLKWSGEALTGGQARIMVGDGLVKVNGQVCLTPGQKLNPGDLVEIVCGKAAVSLRLVSPQ